MKKSVLLKAIRSKCIDCSGSSWQEAERCPVVECSLHPYRFGEKLLEEEKEKPKFARGTEGKRKKRRKRSGPKNTK